MILPELETLSAELANEATTERQAPRGRRGPRWIRAATCSVILPASLVVAGLLVRWAAYRHRHVICDDASVMVLVTNVGARLEGVVMGVEVRPGQRVRAGDILARFDDRYYRAIADRARSQLESAIGQVEAERIDIEHKQEGLAIEALRAAADREAAAAELHAAQAETERWEKEHDWLSQLSSKGAASAGELNDAVANLGKAGALDAAARARHEAAELACRQAEHERDGLRVRSAQLKVLESQIEVARAALEAAEADVAATLIRAPQDGWVLRQDVGPGASVKMGDSILTMRLDGPVWVDCWIEAADVGEIEIGSRADVLGADTVLAGYVDAIGVLMDTQLVRTAPAGMLRQLSGGTPKLNIRIALPQPGDGLIPGMPVMVGIHRNAPPGVLAATYDERRE